MQFKLLTPFYRTLQLGRATAECAGLPLMEIAVEQGKDNCTGSRLDSMLSCDGSETSLGTTGSQAHSASPCPHNISFNGFLLALRGRDPDSGPPAQKFGGPLEVKWHLDCFACVCACGICSIFICCLESVLSYK